MHLLMLAFSVVVAASATAAFADDECGESRQIGVLALNMYHEARGDGHDAMLAVGEVTLNRVKRSRWPDNVCDVVYQRSQFSWTHTINNHTPDEEESWNIALDIAEGLIYNKIELLGTKATHYINPDKVKIIPSWIDKLEFVGRLGNHVFYEEKET